MQLQPLPREVINEAAGFAVRQHPVHRLLQALAVQRAALGRREEAVVGHRTPEKIREPRGEFRVRETLTGHRVALDQVDEVSGGQHTLQRHSIGVRRLFAGFALGAVRLQILLQFLLLHRSTPGAFSQALQMLRNHFGRGVIRRHEADAPRLFRLRH